MIRGAVLIGAACLATYLPAASAQIAVADTVFIVPGSHLDVGFTGPISEVRARRVAILDNAIAAARRDRSFVWFEEGGWSVEAWLDHYHADPARIAELRALVQRHQIGVGATMLSPYAAGFPGALRFLTMHLDRVQRELGVRPDVAVLNDVPGVPEAYVDALARAGIHYLLMGPNLVFSRPLTAPITSGPFYWETASGAKILVDVDTNGYSAAITRWGLPPACLRAMNPREFPPNVSGDQILGAAVGGALQRHATSSPLGIIQQALDNDDPECAVPLPAALREWNTHSSTVRLIASQPDVFFHHLEAQLGSRIPVHRGEWGADWDLLRMSEPVWSWRLRRAIARIPANAPDALRIAAISVADHNVGLGPRWEDGIPESEARRHIADVAALYRQVVTAASGPGALTAVPPAVPIPRGPRDARWSAIVGDAAHAVRVRAGPAFLTEFAGDSAVVVPTPIAVGADARQIVAHVTIDRVALERRLGTRYQAVIEVPLHAPISALRWGASDSPDALAGRWLSGAPPDHIVSPAGVRVNGPGWTIAAHGPLLIGWALRPDAVDPKITWLEALAVVHAVEGRVTGGAPLRLPFAVAYPGEPAVPAFDLVLDRLSPP